MTKMLLTAALMAFALQAQAEVYKIDAAASTVSWKAEKKISAGHHGKVSVKEGQVDVNAKNEVTSGNVVVDMKTIVSDDLASSKKDHDKLVGHLSSGDFFDVAKYPTATFKLTSISKGIAKGELTFIGKTNPVEFPVNVKVDKGIATAEGKVVVDRTKWGLKYGSGNIFKELTADKIIKDEFELTFNLTAKK